MTRKVPEWIGKTDETTPPPRVKARIVMAQDGICACGCGQKLAMSGERIEFDHKQALILGGENRETNLRALRSPCHKTKTREDVAQKSKEARKRSKHLGFHKPRSVLAGSRASKWKAKVGGGWVRRDEE